MFARARALVMAPSTQPARVMRGSGLGRTPGQVMCCMCDCLMDCTANRDWKLFTGQKKKGHEGEGKKAFRQRVGRCVRN